VIHNETRASPRLHHECGKASSPNKSFAVGDAPLGLTSSRNVGLSIAFKPEDRSVATKRDLSRTGSHTFFTAGQPQGGADKQPQKEIESILIH